MNFLKDSSLSFKTLLITWTITSVFTVMFTALQIFFEYKTEKKELYNTYDIINDLYVAPMSESLWIMNKSIIKTQATSLMGYPYVSYVKVFDDDTVYFENGAVSGNATKQFKLIYGKESIGHLEISINEDLLNKKFAKRVLVTVLIQGLKAVVVCVILFFAYELLITRSLRRVSNFLNTHPDASSKGEKIPFDFERKDELGILVRNLNGFIDYIHGLNKNLKDLNDGLEKKVDERTFELKDKNMQLVSAINDLELAHNQIAISERMASLGKMTAGIAHEIKNPIYIIVNSVSLIKELLNELIDEIPEESKSNMDLSIKSDIEDLCKRSETSCERVSNIISSMLSLSRSQEDETSVVNLGTLVQKSVRFAYDATMAKNIFDCNLILNIPKNIDGVTVYKTELTRALINIFDNAFYAMFKEFQINKTLKPQLKVDLIEEEAQYVLHIEDNGPGITEEAKKNLFYPFYTTKPAGEGTGLGMSITFDIIKKHGGSIDVDTQMDKGAKFTILLPKRNIV